MLGFLTLAMLLMAVTASNASAVTITVQGVPDASDNSISAMASRAVLQSYAEQYPHVTIQRFSMPEIGGGGMDSGPLMAIAAGIPPHAIYVNFRQSSTYIEQGFLEPIEVLLARVLSDNDAERQTDDAGRWNANPTDAEIAHAIEQIRMRTPSRAWEVVYRESDAPDGRDKSVKNARETNKRSKHVWAIPTSTLVTALLYRKDLFHEAGLDPEHPPRTWDELLTDARRLTVPDRNQYGVMIHGGREALSWGIYTFLVSNGARAVERTEDGNWSAAYGSREAAEAVEYVWRLAKEPFERDGKIIHGAVKIGTSELDVLWQRGQIAMRFDYLDDELLANINPQLVGIAPVPLSPRGTRGSELNCRMLGVFSGASPQQQLAVMRYIWFITSEQAQRIRTRVYVENGYGTFVNPNLLAKFGHQRLLQRVPKAWQQAFDTTLAHGVPEPYGRNTQYIYRYMSKPISQILEMDFSHNSHEQAVATIQHILSASADGANVKMLGNIPPDQMRQRRIVAGLVVTLIIAVFGIGAVKLWRQFSQTSAASVDVGGRRRRLIGWGLLLPALAITLLWMYVPLSGGLALAFTDYRLVVRASFVGLDNFGTVLYDAEFWKSLGRTFFYVTLMISLGFWPPILLAILLDEVPTSFFKYIFRTVFYLPAIISGVIIMFLWKQLYDPSASGALNQVVLLLNHLDAVSASVVKLVVLGLWASLLGGLVWLPFKLDEISRPLKALSWLGAAAMLVGGLWFFIGGELSAAGLIGRFHVTPLRWVSSPQMAMFCVVLPTVWAGAGPGCLLYLAALKTIPNDLYEAADIDGAGLWHKVCYITLPRLKFLIGIQFIAAIVGAFKGGTDYILAMTGGGPSDATLILALNIFIRTFMDLKFGIGTAMAWLLGLLLVGFTAYQLRLLSRAEFSAGTTGKGG